MVSVEGGRAVLNVYQHVFLNDGERPTMAFIGLPWSVIPFYMFHLQAKWVAAVFARAVALPPQTDMEKASKNREEILRLSNEFPDKFHYLGDTQWSYFRFLCEQTYGCRPEDDKYITTCEDIYNDNKRHFPAYPGAPDTYRKRLYSVDRSTGGWQVLDLSEGGS